MSETLKISNTDSDWNPKYFGIVAGSFCALYIITNAVNTKIIDLAGFILPAGIIIFPLCTILADLMTEIYGFNRARQIIWTVLACTILYALFLTLGIHLPPAGFWQNQSAYETIFSTSWRMALAGCLAWLMGELTNSFVLAKMKLIQHGKHMSVRFIGSTIIGQFVDTVVFCTVAFVGLMPGLELLKMMLIAWVFKVLYETLALPLSVTITKWVKKREGIDHFDNQKISFI